MFAKNLMTHQRRNFMVIFNETNSKVLAIESNRYVTQLHTTVLAIYSEVPNNSVTFLILFWDFFLPTWPY